MGGGVVDDSAYGGPRTWREDDSLMERLARERPRDRRPRARRPSSAVLLPSLPSSRLLKQVTIAVSVFLLLAAGLRLPYGLGDRLGQSLAGVLSSDTDLERVAATIRQLADAGRQWAVAELGSDSLPVVLPETDGVPAASGERWLWPLEGEVITAFGWHDTAGGASAFHGGIDIAGAEGDLVVAAAGGRVLRVEPPTAETGAVVEIDHGGGLTTRYAELRRTFVNAGEHVEAGDVIGEIGAGAEGDAPHLHFELLRDGKQVDPEPKLRRGQAGP